MKIFIHSFILTGLISLSLSCEKSKDESSKNIDFYQLEDRIGKWANNNSTDILEFVDDTNLIRHYGSDNKFIYRIADSSLFIRLINSQIETQLPIIESKGNKIKFPYMYMQTTDNLPKSNYTIYTKIK
jgi:hypothetical protein